MIFHEEHRLSGSIDIVFRNLDDGTFSIYDWKRSKEIKKTAFGGAFAKTQGIEHLPDSNFWHYSLQLNTYKTILEQKYEMVIRDMFLVCLHPDNPNKSYIKLKVPELSDEMRELLPYNIFLGCWWGWSGGVLVATYTYIVIIRMHESLLVFVSNVPLIRRLIAGNAMFITCRSPSFTYALIILNSSLISSCSDA
jgi:hypothetical protein